MIYAELDFIKRHVPAGVRVLDVGSSDADFRSRPKLSYDLAQIVGSRVVNFDMKEAPGVDVVGDAQRLLSYFGRDAFDAIICTSLLEHVRRPWVVVFNMSMVLAPGGVAVLSAPWHYEDHADPIDCWRIGQEGMRGLTDLQFDEIACESVNDPNVGIVVTMWAGRLKERSVYHAQI